MIIITLWLAQVALFVGSWLGPWRDAPERMTNGRLPVQARMLLSLLLVVAAVYIWQGNRGLPFYSQWVAYGMIASFAGDLIMARLIPLPNRLIGGMIAFAIAHALYITAYVQMIATISALPPHDNWIIGLSLGAGFYGVISFFGWIMLIRNPQKGAVINLGALVYGLWVGAMAAFALALGFALGGGFWLTAVGGLLFVSSDFIIGITDIRGLSLKNANDWIWLTYVLGQMGIIYAATIQ